MQQPLPRLTRKNEYLAELLGTYLLVFVGPGSVIVASFLDWPPHEALAFVAAVFGGTVAIAILLFGRLSGAHINPAVTVASVAAGQFKRDFFLPYVVFQMAGGLLAGLSLRLAFGTTGLGTDFGSTRLAIGISPEQGLALEILGTFLLAMSALVAGSYVSNAVGRAIVVGATLFLLILLIGPFTGASFNPARSLGPSIFSGYLTNQAIYYIGPLAGGAIAGMTFGMMRKKSNGK